MQPTPFTLHMIAQEVAGYFDLTLTDLVIHKRAMDCRFPRQLAHYLCRQAGASYPQIATALNRHHSTIMHSVRVVEWRLLYEPLWALRIKALQAALIRESFAPDELADSPR